MVAKWARVGPDWLAASLLFWPYPAPGGKISPIYGIGWTLNFEVFFYFVFAVTLVAKRGYAIALVSGGLAAFVLLGALATLPQPFAYWSNSIVIDFIFGVFIGALHAYGFTIPRRVGYALVGAGAAFFLIAALVGYNALPPGYPMIFPRWIAWGAPLALVAAGRTLAPPAHRTGRPSPLARLGDASYSIYLTHVFVIVGLRPVLPVIERAFGGPAGYPYFAAATQVALIFLLVISLSVLIYKLFERPLTDALTRKIKSRTSRPNRSEILSGGDLGLPTKLA
jgi:exopolysaccharide production protein ExoZ